MKQNKKKAPPKPRLPLPPVAMSDNLYSIQRSKLQQRSKAGEHASPMSILDNHELHNIVVDEAERTWRKVLPLVPQLGVPQLVELRAFALSEAVTRQAGRARGGARMTQGVNCLFGNPLSAK